MNIFKRRKLRRLGIGIQSTSGIAVKKPIKKVRVYPFEVRIMTQLLIVELRQEGLTTRQSNRYIRDNFVEIDEDGHSVGATREYLSQQRKKSFALERLMAKYEFNTQLLERI